MTTTTTTTTQKSKDIIIEQEKSTTTELYCDNYYQKHPIETTELINGSLELFNKYVEDIDPKEKEYLLLAEEKCLQLLTNEFKLMFLRTEVFNVKLAVSRYIQYWINRVDLFGIDKAFLPIHINNGLLHDNKNELLLGYLRTVYNNERLLLVTPSCTTNNNNTTNDTDDKIMKINPNDPNTINGITRACFYVMSKALENSIEMQKKGVISIVDLYNVKTFDYKLIKRIATIFTNGFPTRSSLCIIINPPFGVTPFINIFKLFLKPKVRKRIQVINNNNTKLEKYIGITYNDLMNNVDHNKWIQDMEEQEELAATTTTTTMLSNTTTKEEEEQERITI